MYLGFASIDGLVWDLGQKDLGLKLLGLWSLREFGGEAERALPAVKKCLFDEKRSNWIAALETVRVVANRLHPDE